MEGLTWKADGNGRCSRTGIAAGGFGHWFRLLEWSDSPRNFLDEQFEIHMSSHRYLFSFSGMYVHNYITGKNWSGIFLFNSYLHSKHTRAQVCHSNEKKRHIFLLLRGVHLPHRTQAKFNLIEWSACQLILAFPRNSSVVTLYEDHLVSILGNAGSRIILLEKLLSIDESFYFNMQTDQWVTIFVVISKHTQSGTQL